MPVSKTTLPFAGQYADWLLGSAFSPEMFNAFKQVKPQMWKQLFGGMPEGALDPYRRFTQQYKPFDYAASNPFGRPGGPSPAEQDLLSGSYFGMTAPLGLGGANQAAGNLSNFNQSLGPGGSYFPNQIANMFQSLGGQVHMPGAEEFPAYMKMIGANMPGGTMGMPTAPSAPAIPGAPSLPAFNFDTAGYTKNAYNSFIAGQPGLSDALRASLNPKIALPGQSIFQQVAGQSGAGGPMDQYVQHATEGTTQAFQNMLHKEQLALNSRFAGEGVFGSGANLQALSGLTADAAAQYAGIIGPMQLQAAEQERGRIYQAAETQYGTEYARNLEQVKIQADQAQKMQQTFASMAASSGSAQAQAQAAAYGDRANYLANIYHTQVSALEQAYGTQANIYGTQMGAYGQQQGQMMGTAMDLYKTQAGSAGQQQGLVMGAAQRAAELMSSNYGMSFDQALKMAKAEQENKQGALDALHRGYYQPGSNLLETLTPFFGLHTVSTSGPSVAENAADWGKLIESLRRR